MAEKGDLMSRLFGSIIGCVALLSLAACSVGKAPLSNPRDMTSGGHCEAARDERAQAWAHERQANSVTASKPAVEQRLRAEHLLAAKKHRAFASQHEQAAIASADGIRCESF
jgi:hypothetical protein